MKSLACGVVAWIAAAWNSVIPAESVLSLPDFITESVAVGALLLCAWFFLRHLTARDQQLVERDDKLLAYMRDRDAKDRDLQNKLIEVLRGLLQKE